MGFGCASNSVSGCPWASLTTGALSVFVPPRGLRRAAYAFLFGFVLVGVFCFFDFDSKTLLCIIIGDENVSIRLVLFFWGVILDYGLFKA